MSSSRAQIAAPAAFLTLLPATSTGYPQQRKSSISSVTSPIEGPKSRRSSSVASDASITRFLKLGPVHNGEHLDECQEDWAVAVSE